MTLEQAWTLSQRWYGNRMAPDFKRPARDEAVAIFRDVGLCGRFWSLP